MRNEATRELVALARQPEPAADDPRASMRAVVEEAKDIFQQQASAVLALADRIDERFAEAVDTIVATPGHTVFFGMGKSGLIAQKLAATFASTGTPSFFVHSAEAHHGDLGMITERDTAVLLSYSGETQEVVNLIPHLRRLGVPIIALVGNLESRLAIGADLALDISVDREACPNNLAPTTSAMATLAMGDALAVALIRRRNFRAADFARFHPGGSLGRRLTVRVRDAMRSESLPVVEPSATVGESLVTLTEGRLGLLLVMNGERLVGLVTDGDLRRAMQRHRDLLSLPVSAIMTDNPVTIDEDTLLDVARQRMQIMKLKALVAVNGKGRVTGVVEVFDEK